MPNEALKKGILTGSNEQFTIVKPWETLYPKGEGEGVGSGARYLPTIQQMYMNQQDGTYVAPYREQVLAPKETQRAELTTIPANERPLSWQWQTAGENYTALHDKAKQAWDKYFISPEDVKAANDYYENELLYKDFPGAIPLAALGSTLSGEAYDAWRDLQTDPANLIGGEIFRAGSKAKDKLLKAFKLSKSQLDELARKHAYDEGSQLLFHGSPTKGIKEFDPKFAGSYGGDVAGRKGLYAGDVNIANKYATGDIGTIGSMGTDGSGSIYTLRVPTNKILYNEPNEEMARIYQFFVKGDRSITPSGNYLKLLSKYMDHDAYNTAAKNGSMSEIYAVLKDANEKMLSSGDYHAFYDGGDQLGGAYNILPQYLPKYKPLFETEVNFK